MPVTSHDATKLATAQIRDLELLYDSICGDGVLDATELCDDGAAEDGDCCSAVCQPEPQGQPCGNDGNPCTQSTCNANGLCLTTTTQQGPCNDGDPCTTDETCTAGTCAATTNVCDPCTHLGDVTQDGTVTVVDMQCIQVVALWQIAGSQGPTPGCAYANPATIADLDCNGTVNVTDVTLAIYRALGAPLNPSIDADQNHCADSCQ
jgi:cysteine-rich repeat protein